MSIYVEIHIRGVVDEVVRLTQTPEFHERWDLRFTSITYPPRESASEPQRFRYATRIGLGIEIEGWGETVSERELGGVATSSLKFGSDDPRSLIRAGSGYWKYEQIGDNVRFIWGLIGRVIDRCFFRPMIGWATAWSFDRLRLWIEDGAPPGRLARQALIHAVAACAVAFTWIWHGLVPKLLGPHPDELAMLLDAGVRGEWVRAITYGVGVFELGFGLAFLPLAHRRFPWLMTIALMIAATIGVLLTAPERAWAAFNPVTLNALLAAAAVIGLLSLRGLPSARRCRRRPPKQQNGER